MAVKEFIPPINVCRQILEIGTLAVYSQAFDTGFFKDVSLTNKFAEEISPKHKTILLLHHTTTQLSPAIIYSLWHVVDDGLFELSGK